MFACKCTSVLRGSYGDADHATSRPRVILTNSAAEYWRGDASLAHMDLTGLSLSLSLSLSWTWQAAAWVRIWRTPRALATISLHQRRYSPSLPLSLFDSPSLSL